METTVERSSWKKKNTFNEAFKDSKCKMRYETAPITYNGEFTNGYGDQNGSHGLSSLIAGGQGIQDGDDAILGYGLQKSRCTNETLKKRSREKRNFSHFHLTIYSLA